jgi:hypothetical protein
MRQSEKRSIGNQRIDINLGGAQNEEEDQGVAIPNMDSIDVDRSPDKAKAAAKGRSSPKKNNN